MNSVRDFPVRRFLGGFLALPSGKYGGERKIAWREVLAGEKAYKATGEWLPQATLDACREDLVSIKGPPPPALPRTILS